MYLYLYLNLFTLFFPLVLSFDRRVRFVQYWPTLLPAIGISAGVFIWWDVLFTQQGVWGFNEDYLVGLWFWGLPLEEILFFVTVPYACMFIYACLNHYVRRDYLQPYAKSFSLGLGVLLLGIGFFHLDQLYTAVTFLLLPVMLAVHYWVFGERVLGRFFAAYVVHLAPFLAVNGVLTAIPIVWYNEAHILSLRIGTIPVEDTMYSMLLLLLNITLFEWFRRKETIQTSQSPTGKKHVQPASSNRR